MAPGAGSFQPKALKGVETVPLLLNPMTFLAGKCPVPLGGIRGEGAPIESIIYP